MGENHQFIIEKGVCFEVVALGQGGHDVEVIFIGSEPFQNSLTVTRLQLRHHLGILAQEGAEILWQEVLGGGHRCQLQRAGDFAVHLLQFFLELIQPTEEVVAGPQQRLALGGEIDLIAHLLEQGCPQNLLQPLHLDRDAGLGEVDRLCRFGIAA